MSFVGIKRNSSSNSSSSSSKVPNGSSPLPLPLLPPNLEEAADQANAMRHQEAAAYSYGHFLPCGRSHQRHRDADPGGLGGCGGAARDTTSRLNITWREKICQWSYNVVDQYVTNSIVLQTSSPRECSTCRSNIKDRCTFTVNSLTTPLLSHTHTH
jgi:hypothetical protein